jgi:flavoprotein
MQSFQATNYQNKRMRYSAAVKSEEVKEWAGLWMRIDGPVQGKLLGFDNMNNRPITGTTDWQQYEVVLDVPQNSTSISFGILLRGAGQVWISNAQFEEVGTDVPVTAPSKSKEEPDKPGNLDFAE